MHSLVLVLHSALFSDPLFSLFSSLLFSSLLVFVSKGRRTLSSSKIMNEEESKKSPLGGDDDGDVDVIMSPSPAPVPVNEEMDVVVSKRISEVHALDAELKPVSPKKKRKGRVLPAKSLSKSPKSENGKRNTDSGSEKQKQMMLSPVREPVEKEGRLGQPINDSLDSVHHAENDSKLVEMDPKPVEMVEEPMAAADDDAGAWLSTTKGRKRKRGHESPDPAIMDARAPVDDPAAPAENGNSDSWLSSLALQYWLLILCLEAS